MVVSAAAVSQMVDRLEKKNLVERMADPGDRRVRNVVLSDQGESFVNQSIEARQSWIKEIPDLLPEDTLYVRIEGGDHHQFGSYEIDPANDHATIERKSQHEQITQPTLDLLMSMAGSE